MYIVCLQQLPLRNLHLRESEIAGPGSGAEDDSEPGEEEPKDSCARLLKESVSKEHMRLHIPKNPAWEICQKSRTYTRTSK